MTVNPRSLRNAFVYVGPLFEEADDLAAAQEITSGPMNGDRREKSREKQLNRWIINVGSSTWCRFAASRHYNGQEAAAAASVDCAARATVLGIVLCRRIGSPVGLNVKPITWACRE